MLAVNTFLHSQTSYITDSAYFQKISDFYFLNDNDAAYQYEDTSVIHFQYSLPFYFNGQMGTAQPDYLLQKKDNEIGSRVFDVYHPDILKKQDIPIYRTKGFYSKLEGLAGSKDEQHFREFFASPFKNSHQINFYFRRSTNTGFYQNQKASVTNLLTDYHWLGKGRWSIDANLILNYIKHQENGGITKDTLSYTDLFLDKILVPVSLSDARKNMQSHTAEVRTNYVLHKDSIFSDAFSLSIQASRLLYQYKDNYPTAGYYPFVFLDTLQTNDSLLSLKVDVPLSYSLKYKRSYFQISYQYQWNKIHLFSDTIMSNHFLILNFESVFKLGNKIKIKFGRGLKYILVGTQKDNYLIDLFAESRIGKFVFKIRADIMRQSPAFQQNFWYSNHFIWYNRFKDILSEKGSLTIKHLSGLELTYNLFFIKNYVYFFDNYPQTYNAWLNIHQLYVGLDRVFFKHLGINARYYYQWKSADVVALPEHFLNGNIYYQGRWFHKNLLVNTGFQWAYSFNYFDTYKYNPATGIYGVSNVSFQSVPYPQIGVFFSGRIKPVNFFVRMDNLLSGILPYPYYYLPHYMMQDRAFRMGISWMFFD